jgi:hypothetical protein
LDEKTADLLAMAKDFHQDADKLKDIMEQRGARLRIMMIATGVGGGGAIILPMFLPF